MIRNDRIKAVTEACERSMYFANQWVRKRRYTCPNQKRINVIRRQYWIRVRHGCWSEARRSEYFRSNGEYLYALFRRKSRDLLVRRHTTRRFGVVKVNHPNTACQDTADSPPMKTSVNRSRGRTTSDIHRINVASDVTRGTSRTNEVDIFFDRHEQDQQTEAHDSDEFA